NQYDGKLRTVNFYQIAQRYQQFLRNCPGFGPDWLLLDPIDLIKAKIVSVHDIDCFRRRAHQPHAVKKAINRWRVVDRFTDEAVTLPVVLDNTGQWRE